MGGVRVTRLTFGLTTTALLGAMYAAAGLFSSAHDVEVGLLVSVVALVVQAWVSERRAS